MTPDTGPHNWTDDDLVLACCQGRLDAEGWRRFRRRLAEAPHLAQDLAALIALQRTWREYEAQAALPLPAGLNERVLAAVHRRHAATPLEPRQQEAQQQAPRQGDQPLLPPFLGELEGVAGQLRDAFALTRSLLQLPLSTLSLLGETN